MSHEYRHPKGVRARILLSSVFGPYAQDDAYGSRAINPMELYHNQVTREQGSFSLRMFHRSWGILMIQHNIGAPCTVLDFPTIEKFKAELMAQDYDVVGLSAIIANVGKVREMCRIVRQLKPKATIIIGGHVAAIPALDKMVDCDIVVRGEGIGWFREYLGQEVSAPIEHPPLVSAFHSRVLGMRMPDDPTVTAATIIPSVGCPMGCNFCTTSAFFGGKGKAHHFFETGLELYDVMLQTEKELHVRSFFIMDENFLLNRKRALELLALMKRDGKSWAFYCFSSMNAIKQYTMEELVQLGVSWIWVGLESPKSSYAKLNDVDTRAMASELQRHGIKLLGSTIVGLEHHTPENIKGEIDYAISHGTDFHQFMLYTPIPGTPLHQQITSEGRMLEGVDFADIHGQFKFNFKHGHISREQSKKYLDWAFRRDYQINGPSIFRICRTMFQGWMSHKDDADPRVRQRYAFEARQLRGGYNAALWAMEKRLKKANREVSDRIRELRQRVEAEFGFYSKLWRAFAGPILLLSSKREDRRLRRGVTYEPPTFIERRNWL